MPILKIIWLALLFCVLIYGGILWQMSITWEKAQPQSPEELAANPIVLALALMSFFSLVMAFTIPYMLARGRQARPEVIRARSIVQWALIESVAIYGVVAGFIVQDARVFVVFGAVAILGFLMTFPSAERMSTPF